MIVICSSRTAQLVVFSACLSAACTEGEPTGATPSERTPAHAHGKTAARRNVIVMIGDGMQMAHEVATSRYLFGEDQALSFHSLPVSAFVTTWDVNGYNTRADALGKPRYARDAFEPELGYDPAIGGEAPYPLLPDSDARREYFLGGPYPDSASTGTAMSTGSKTDYNNIAWASGDPPGGELESSPTYLRNRYGMSVGFVTTGPISHATPADWFAHNVDRFNYLPIGHEILTITLPDVAIGSGVGPEQGNYVDSEDFAQAAQSGRWVVVEREAGVDGAASVLEAAERAVAANKGLLGVFGGAAGVFESPVPSDAPSAPHVARGSLENPRLADASVAALRVLAQNPRGFFAMIEQADIDWANHANDFSRMIGCTFDLHQAVQAVVDFVDEPGDAVDWDNTTLLVTADHANSYLRLLNPLGPGNLPTQAGASYPDGDVSYGTGNHTGELVTLHARGRAAPRVLDYATQFPGLPIVDNTSIYWLTLDGVER